MNVILKSEYELYLSYRGETKGVLLAAFFFWYVDSLNTVFQMYFNSTNYHRWTSSPMFEFSMVHLVS